MTKVRLPKSLLALFLALLLLLGSCGLLPPADTTAPTSQLTTAPTTTAPSPGSAADLSSLPPYSGYPYVTLGDGVPDFTEEELSHAATSYEFYSPLDSLGRCGVAHASVGVDIMPTEERGSIGMVKPSGWHTVKYDVVDGKYLYNRCHLIGFQLTGENANVGNLITGTRYLNVVGMLPFENDVAEYVERTENHVLYRVTPVFVGNELVARGVVIEALSVEDGGVGISFHVFIYNVQPSVVILYADGTSYLSNEPPPQTTAPTPAVTTTPAVTEERKTYVVNTNTDKFHLESCRYADSITPENRDVYVGTRSYLIEVGFEPCGTCHP